MPALARPLILALGLLAPLAASSLHAPEAEAQDLILIGSLTESRYAIEVVPGPDLTTLAVERTFFNPTLEHQQLHMAIDLPKQAILDRLELRGPDRRGKPNWIAASVEDPAQARERMDAHRYGDGGDAPEGDLLAVLSREFGAELDLYPVPPLRERSVRYRVQLASSYEQGRYRIELPVLALEHPDGTSKGAALTIRAPKAKGFDLVVDGQPAGDTLPLDGSVAHVLELVPHAADEARSSLAAIDLRALGVRGEPAGIVAAQLDLPSELIELPEVRRVVVLVDGSHSLSDFDRDELLGLAGAYLDELGRAWPNARAEVLTFDHEVHAIHGGFVAPSVAAATLAEVVPATRNGSDVDLALAHARDLLDEAADSSAAAEPGVDWIVLLSDLELRSAFAFESELAWASSGEVRLHVVEPDHQGIGWYDTLRPAAPDHPWTEIARAAAGGHFIYEAVEGRIARDGAELIRPNRVRELRAIHTDERGRKSEVELATVADAGTRHEWIERLAASPGEQVRFEAQTWAAPLRWSARASESAALRWAGLLTSAEAPLVLAEHESRALAEFAALASPWTSLLAEARFDGAPQLAMMWGTGGSMFGHSIGATHCGGVTSARRGLPLDLEQLRAMIEQALDACEGTGSIALELYDQEIVVVESSHACAREAMWALDLRGMPLFGRTSIQTSFAGSGVTPLQWTALTGETALSWLD